MNAKTSCRFPFVRRLTITAAFLLGVACVHAQNPPVTVSIDTDREELFVHESFTLTLTVRAKGVRLSSRAELTSMPPDDILKCGTFQELPIERKPEGNIVVETKRYRCEARVMTAGQVKIAPTLRIGLLQRQRMLIGSSWVESLHSVDAAPQTLVVNPLPATNRPENFSGAVGQFSFTVRLSPTNVVPGELVTARLEIRGMGYLDGITPPRIPPARGFKMYDPERVDDKQTTGLTFKQVIATRTTNAVAIPETSFCFFDPRERTYETIVEGPFTLNYHAAENETIQPFRPDEATSTENETGAAPAAEPTSPRANRAARITLALAAYWIAAAGLAIWMGSLPATRLASARATRRRVVGHRAVGVFLTLAAAAVLSIPYRGLVGRLTHEKRMAALVHQTDARFAPSQNALVTFHLGDGQSVEVLDTWRDWVKVAVGDRRAWIPADALAVTPR